jgi:RHS repeat-associated protein
VIGLVNPAGVQRAAYTYDPYGAQATATALNGTLPPNPWRYAGGYLDPTGLYHFGARYYEPGTGRWTQQDSVVSLGNPADGNRYEYVRDDPMNNIDPSGFGICPFGRNKKGGCNGKKVIEGVGVAGADTLACFGGGSVAGDIVGAAAVTFASAGTADVAVLAAGAAGCFASGFASDKIAGFTLP